MTWRRVGSAALFVVVVAVLPVGCGQKDEDRPPPTIGDPAVVDRSGGGGGGATGTTIVPP
jgi:hypothetical protein